MTGSHEIRGSSPLSSTSGKWPLSSSQTAYVVCEFFMPAIKDSFRKTLPRRSKVRFTPTYFFTKISHPPVPLLILFRKRVRSRRLFAGKRAYNGFGSLPIFCELGGFLLFCLFFVVPFLPVERLDKHFAFGAFVIPIFRYLRMWDVFLIMVIYFGINKRPSSTPFEARCNQKYVCATSPSQ